MLFRFPYHQTSFFQQAAVVCQRMVGILGHKSGNQDPGKIIVILAAHLLGEKHSAGLQQPENLLSSEVLVAVQDDVKTAAFQRKQFFPTRFHHSDAQRFQPLAAQLHIGQIPFRYRGVFPGVSQCQQKFPAAGTHVQQFFLRAQQRTGHGFIVPREFPVLTSAVEMGKIPARKGRGLFFFPKAIQRLFFLMVQLIHRDCSFQF